MDFPIHIDTLSMGVPIVYFKGSQVELSKIRCICGHKGFFLILANSEHPNEMQHYNASFHLGLWGAQWLSGRVLDSRPKGCGFEPHRCHYVISLSKTQLSLLSTGSTQEDPSQRN